MKDGTLRLKAEGAHIEVVCGPLEKCAGRDKKGFETFRRVAYECGSDKPKRSFTAWLVAVCDGDSTYKDAVRPIEIKLPR